jgi:hypothetical protein
VGARGGLRVGCDGGEERAVCTREVSAGVADEPRVEEDGGGDRPRLAGDGVGVAGIGGACGVAGAALSAVMSGHGGDAGVGTAGSGTTTVSSSCGDGVEVRVGAGEAKGNCASSKKTCREMRTRPVSRLRHR